MAKRAASAGEFIRLLKKSPLPAEEITAVIAARHWADLGKGNERRLSRTAVIETVMQIPATTRFARKLAAEATKAADGWDETGSSHYRSILALLEGVQDGGTGLIAPLARITDDIGRAKTEVLQKPLARLESSLRKGSAEDIQSSLLRVWAVRAALYFNPALRKQFAAPLKEKIAGYTQGRFDKITMETRFSDSLLAKLCHSILPGDTAAGTIKKALKSAHPVLYSQINQVFSRAKLSTPLQRAALSRLLDSRLYNSMKTTARKADETAARLETASIELKQAKVALRNMLMRKVCTFGFGGNPEAKQKVIAAKERMDRLEERFSRLDHETKILKRLLVTYTQGTARALKILSRSMNIRLKAEFTPHTEGGKSTAAHTFLDGLKSLKIGSPADEKFWQIVLKSALRDMAVSRSVDIVAKLNNDCAAAYKGQIPTMAVQSSPGKTCIDICVDTVDAGVNIFTFLPNDLLEKINEYTGEFHSFKEVKQAKIVSGKLKKQMKKIATASNSVAADIRFKVLAVDNLEKLKDLHRREKRRIKPRPVQELLPAYTEFLEKLSTDSDKRYADHAVEMAGLIPPMTSGLLELDEGYGRITADGREILLEMEKIFLEKSGTPEENMSRVKHAFDTARSELLSLEPTLLKQLTKKVPALKRSMNFMSKEQKVKKENKKNSIRG